MGKLHKIRRAFWKEVEASGSNLMPRYTSVEIVGRRARRRSQVRVNFGAWWWSRHSYQGFLKSLYREYDAINRF